MVSAASAPLLSLQTLAHKPEESAAKTINIPIVIPCGNGVPIGVNGHKRERTTGLFFENHFINKIPVKKWLDSIHRISRMLQKYCVFEDTR